MDDIRSHERIQAHGYGEPVELVAVHDYKSVIYGMCVVCVCCERCVIEKGNCWVTRWCEWTNFGWQAIHDLCVLSTGHGGDLSCEMLHNRAELVPYLIFSCVSCFSFPQHIQASWSSPPRLATTFSTMQQNTGVRPGYPRCPTYTGKMRWVGEFTGVTWKNQERAKTRLWTERTFIGCEPHPGVRPIPNVLTPNPGNYHTQ